MLLSAFPIGPELHVNTFTNWWQLWPAVASHSNGSFIVAWTSYGQDGDAGIFAQRYNADGGAAGGEFQVNTHTLSWQRDPSIAIDAQGRFLIAWSSSGQDGEQGGIYAQRFTSDGVPDGIEFRVNTHTPGSQQLPVVAMTPAGEAIVAWESTSQDGSAGGIYAQRYDSSSDPVGGEFRVNALTEGHQEAPSIAVADTGEFTVTWMTAVVFDGPADIVARRFNSRGVPLGVDFAVQTYTTGSQSAPAVATDAGGNFVIAWAHDGPGTKLPQGIYARRFDTGGAPQGVEFPVHAPTPEYNVDPAVAMRADGEFAVIWRRVVPAYDNGYLYAQRFSFDGAALGGEFRASSRSAGPRKIGVAMDDDGDFVTVWTQDPIPEEKHLLYDVYAQRYQRATPDQAGTVGDRAWNDIDGDGIQEAEEPNLPGVTVELLNDFGSFALATVTDAAGQYSLNVPVDVPARLRFVAPAGMIPTAFRGGSNSGVDSDADPNGFTPVFQFSDPGQTESTIDAGFLPPAAISGVVFSDLNGDGDRDTGEPGVPSFVVFTDIDGNGIRDTGEPAGVSAIDGTYTIANILPGSYDVVLFNQDLWLEPPAREIVVAPSAPVTGVDMPARTTVADTVAVAVGAEFRVNTFTGGWQTDPRVAVDAAGNFLVVWRADQGASGPGAYAQRYSPAGVPMGSEIRLIEHASPSIAMEADGDFVLAWNSQQPIGAIARVQRFDSAGAPKGPAVQVNTITSSQHYSAEVAVSDGGEFVVAWQADFVSGSVVYARAYDANGQPTGTEFRVADGVRPRIAMEPDGDFVVTWSRGDFSDTDVYARRYARSAQPRGSEFRVNSVTTGQQILPSVAVDANGGFVIIWQSISQFGVIAQRYNAEGLPEGGQFRVNTTTGPVQRNPEVAVNANGEIAFAWETQTDGSQSGILARRFGAAGVPQDSELRVNTYTTSPQVLASLAVDADGDMLVVWASREQDGSGYGIFAQRYAVVPTVSTSDFLFESAPHRLRFNFDRDVRDSLGTDDLVVRSLNTGHTLPPSQFALLYDDDSDVATFMYLGQGSDAIGGVLPDGDYRATLLASGISTTAGANPAADYSLEFFFLNGDANRDGRVTLRDFNILADNFGRTGTSFPQGDFTYDGITDLDDFNLLVARFGAAIPASTATLAQRPLTGMGDLDEDDSIRIV
jgi:hypothetical protein